MTEQWTLMEKLQRSEARYALAVQGTSDGIWQFDMRTRMTEASPPAARVAGPARTTTSGSPLDWVT
jgi:PAS domain-containing protein